MLLSLPRPFLSVACLLLGGLTAASAEIDFQRDVLPLLENHCLDCHSGDGGEANLSLDSEIAALAGGDSGEPAITPGDSNRSYLLHRVTTSDAERRMPPNEDPLTPEQIDLLRRWIDDADRWQDAAAQLAETANDHWSFVPPRRPPVPEMSPAGPDAVRTAGPIDNFVRVGLEAIDLQPSPLASRRQRIRRLYLVMHGLPPTPRQVQAFLQDTRPDAWARLVDRVLASPRYGERWATSWLDLVRFGETHGFETNRERPHAWRYRDWVIDSLNDDKPYDRFVVEQLAGDAVGEHLGTGFLVAGPYDLVKGQNIELQQMQRQDELADMINTTGTAFLGLTLGCARCHNHKFDPVSQTDYYALQAVFAGVQYEERQLPPSADTKLQLARLDQQIDACRDSLRPFLRDPNQTLRPPVNARRNVDAFSPVPARFVRFTIEATNGGEPCLDELEVWAGESNVALSSTGAQVVSSGNFQHPLHKLPQINDGRYGNPHSWIASQISGGWVQVELAELQPVERVVWGRDRSGRYVDRLATTYRIETSVDGDRWTRVASSADRQAAGDDPSPQPQYDFVTAAEGGRSPEEGRAVYDRLQRLQQRREALSQPVLAFVGTFVQPGPTHRLYRGEPSAPRERVTPAVPRFLGDVRLPEDAPEQQRRLKLARWIADPQNPLTARVIVNRLWQGHFGTGIVDTPSDFGGSGTQPTHPQLLDWLAVELIENGWSLKHIHRQILLSHTWQQTSDPRREAMQRDAGARYLWRFPPRRLSAEAIRDSMLTVSGQLDLQAGGPGFSAFEVQAENVRHYFPKTQYGPEDWRRMIYMTKVRQERDAVFGVFDCPDGSQVTPRRSRSTTPLQALNLLNSPFVLQQADLWAERLVARPGSTSQRISAAYEQCFGRPAEDDEIALAAELIRQAGWQAFTRAMLNANELVFLP